MLSNLQTPSKAFRSLAAIAAGLIAIVSPAVGHGQVAPRVLAPVDESSMVSLKGNINPLAQPKWDRGPVEDSVSGRMLLVLKRSTEQESALRQLVSDQQNSHSPNFHKWLTPAQFGAEFGVADSDIESVTGYLRGRGFTVGRVYKNKSAIEVTGTAGQLRDTFHTQIHSYSINGHEFYANVSEPKIPAALAPVVRGFASLNNINTNVLAASTAVSIPAEYDQKTRRVKPLYTGANGTLANYLLSPADIQTIYNIPVSTSSPGAGGSGVTVGVVGDVQINLSLIERYQSVSGTGSHTPIEIVDGNDPSILPPTTGTVDATAGTDATIAYEQLEMITASAPNANLSYYTSAGSATFDTGLDFAIIRAVEDDAVSVLTIGFQACELNITPVGNQVVEASWLQASAEGITVVAAAGDSGSGACDIPGVSASTGGIAVNGYASTPYDVAVGGTDFYYGNPAQPGNYWSATNNPNNFESADGYIPEQAWNDSIQTTDYTTTLPSIVHAGGGGLSLYGNVAANGVTESAYPVPSWQISAQQASGITSPSARSLPDVAMFAGDAYNGAAYAICAAPSDCEISALTVTATGGTASAAGVFAGIMAEVVEKYGLQGNANLPLYALASTTAFHSALAGSTNSVVCTTGTGCTGGYLQANGAKAYTIGGSTTYNLITGLGSVNATNLINTWKVPATVASTTKVSITNASNVALTSPATVVHGSYLNLKATITGSDATGSVAFTTGSLLPNENGNAAAPVVSGVAIVPPYDDLLVGGSYNLTARYSGDGKYLPSVGTFALTVLPESSRMLFWNGTTYVTTPPAQASIVYGNPFSVIVEPFSMNNNDVSIPTGSVGVYDSTVSVDDPTTLLDLSSEGTATLSTNLLSGSKTHGLTFEYNGDPSFSPSTSGTYNVQVTQAATNTQLSADVAPYKNASTVPSELTAVVSPGISIAAGSTVGIAGGFVADVDYNSGATYTPGKTITVPANLPGAAPAAVYANGREFPQFTYTIPGLSAGGYYTVVLHFAELYFSTAAQREFNVAINGTTVLTNFDIFVAAGNKEYTAVIESFPGIVANASGQIVISFTSGPVDQPLVSGIEIQTTTGVPPTGSVGFNTVGGNTTATLTPAYSYTGQAIGVATIPVTSAQVPTTGSITATYNADPNYLGSTQNIALTSKANTYTSQSTLQLSLSSNPVATNQALSVTTTITPATNGNPAGTVALYANGVSIGPAFTPTTGTFTYAIPLVNNYLPFASGNVSITAVFMPTAVLESPSSATVNLTVTDDRTTADFALSTDTQSQAITSSSNMAYFKAQITSLQNFAGLGNQIGLTCTVPNSSLGCTFSSTSTTTSTSVTLSSNGSAVVPFVIYAQPSGGTGALHAPVTPTHWWLVGGGSALACVFLLGIPTRRKGVQSWLGAVLCVIIISGSISGCGASRASEAAISGSGSQSQGGSAHANYSSGLAPSGNTIAPGTYTVVITGTASTNTTLVHNTAVTVVVSAGDALTNGTTGKNYTITNFISPTRLLTDPGAATATGTGVVLNSADATADQVWTISYQKNGYYAIQNAVSLKYLTGTGQGNQVVQNPALATADGSQWWTLNSLEGGYEVINAANGCALDVQGFSTSQAALSTCSAAKQLTASPTNPATVNDAVDQTWYFQAQ